MHWKASIYHHVIYVVHVSQPCLLVVCVPKTKTELTLQMKIKILNRLLKNNNRHKSKSKIIRYLANIGTAQTATAEVLIF